MNVIDTAIHSILLSDHAPLSMTFSSVFDTQHRTKQWRFSNSLLQDAEFVSLITQRTDEFFRINMNSVSSIQTVWEAFKVTCRGWIIAYSTAKCRLRNLKKNDLLVKIKTLESKHMVNTTNLALKRDLLMARVDLQSILHEETAFALYRLRRRNFESGDKAGKMLAYQLKQQESKQSIPAIRGSSGNIITEQALISSAFKEYYSKLYQTESQPQEHKVAEFLMNIPLPKLSASERDELEAPVRDIEILTAIKKLANGKSPGGDGYTIEFYKPISAPPRQQRSYVSTRVNVCAPTGCGSCSEILLCHSYSDLERFCKLHKILCLVTPAVQPCCTLKRSRWVLANVIAQSKPTAEPFKIFTTFVFTFVIFL